MNYNFDEIIDREGTNAVKLDLRKQFFGTNDILPMWVADMDFRTPDFIVNAVKKRSEHEIYGYTVLPESFFSSISDWMQKRHHWKIPNEWISFTPGVVPALAMSVLAFTKPGDKIILQSPVYHPFFTIIEDNERSVINNTLKIENGRYSIDFKNLESQIDSKTKMLLLCNPHNPVGRVWTKEELTKLGNLCVKHNIIIVSDEIHSDLIFKNHTHIPIASISEAIAQKTITCIAPSKTFNMPGLVTSAVIIPNTALSSEYTKKLMSYHLFIGNPFGITALEVGYRHGEEWLSQVMTYVQKNAELVSSYLEENISAIKVIQPEATYLLWLDCRDLKMSDAELKAFMVKKAKVGLFDGSDFGRGGEGFMRMNIACPRSVIQEALSRIKRAFT